MILSYCVLIICFAGQTIVRARSSPIVGKRRNLGGLAQIAAISAIRRMIIAGIRAGRLYFNRLTSYHIMSGGRKRACVYSFTASAILGFKSAFYTIGIISYCVRITVLVRLA